MNRKHTSRLFLLPALVGLFSAALPTAFAQQSAPPAATTSVDPHANETRSQRDARMKWWREAWFGMFIHWGLYAVPAGTYDGKRTSGGQNRNVD